MAHLSLFGNVSVYVLVLALFLVFDLGLALLVTLVELVSLKVHLACLKNQLLRLIELAIVLKLAHFLHYEWAFRVLLLRWIYGVQVSFTYALHKDFLHSITIVECTLLESLILIYLGV